MNLLEEKIHSEERKKSSGEFRTGALLGFTGGLFLTFIVLILLAGTGMIRFSKLSSPKEYAALESKILTKVSILERYFSAYFLDEIDEETMEDSVYKGVVNGLGDKYAAYYTKDEFKDIQEKNQGFYSGIGAYITMNEKEKLVQIVEVIKNGPAEKAGMQAGDLIYQIDGKDAAGMDSSAVQALVKGEKGSKVVLTVLRGKKQLDITVIRDDIQEDTVAFQMLPGKIGYVRVTGFEQITVEQFQNAVDTLEKKNQKAMVIDLRNNGGGLLDSAVSMLDRLLPKGLVVYSEDKKGLKEEYFAEDDIEFKKPLAILVNGYSASAAEIFSGAIQDKNEGVLVGTKTYGKGIVQGIFDLGDGSALKITTAKYYTPNGRNIHGKGLTPDIEVELGEKMVPLSDGNTEVDTQLKAAMDYLTDKADE